VHPSQRGHRALADLVVGVVWRGIRHAVSETGVLAACPPGGSGTPEGALERVRAALLDKESALEDLPARIVRGDTDTVGAVCMLQVRPSRCSTCHSYGTCFGCISMRLALMSTLARLSTDGVCSACLPFFTVTPTGGLQSCCGGHRGLCIHRASPNSRNFCNPEVRPHQQHCSHLGRLCTLRGSPIPWREQLSPHILCDSNEAAW
jgi:hypothetical protein